MLVLGAFFLTSVFASDSPTTDQLLFRDGDMLFGKLLSFDAPGTLRWQHPDASSPIEFKAANISQINFPPRDTPVIRTNHSCRLYLRDGDFMQGVLVSCDKEKLVLDTWYAGPLAISRAALNSLHMIPSTPGIYDGPDGLDGWTVAHGISAFAGESGEWTSRGGAFYANKPASVARDLKLPDMSEMEFDVAWKGQLNMAIALYTDSLQPILLTSKENGPDFGGFYSFRLNNGYVDLWPIKKRGQSPSLGVAMAPTLSQKSHAHVDLRMSKPQGRVALFVDGVLVKDWIDPNGFVGEGTGVRFVHNGGGSVKLSNIRVTHWDGVMEPNPSAPADSQHDTLWLSDGSQMAGTVVTMAHDTIGILTPLGTLQVPLGKIRQIEFAEHPESKTLPTAASWRATFAQWGVVTFDLEKWTPEGVVVSSPNFGKATFNPAAFSRLRRIVP